MKEKNMVNVLENIYNSSLKFLVPLNLEETYATVVDEAVKLVKGDDGVILLYKDDRLQSVYSSSSRKDTRGTTPRPSGYSITSFKEQKASFINYETLKKIHPQLVDHGIRSIVFIPLSYKNKSIGVLLVRMYEDRNFTENELGILKLFGSLASVAIKKSYLYEEVQKSLELRDLFISMASHELRTPLTTIMGYTELLRKKLDDRTTKEAKWVEKLHKENKRLEHLIKELLEVSRIKTGQLQYMLEECNLSDIVKGAVETFHYRYPTRKLVYENNLVNGDGKIIGDYNKLLQVIENLLANAVKFSSSDTPVKIELEKRPRSVIIRVVDKGKGIKKEYFGKIFDKYFVGEDHNKEGMGLGLFIVKDIVEKHHGRIKMKSKINKGTTVEILLPRLKV